MARPGTNPEKSILNSILNFAGRKPLTYQRVYCHFYITLFHYLFETKPSMCGPGIDSIATVSIASKPPSV
jgi:hypothetical protein